MNGPLFKPKPTAQRDGLPKLEPFDARLFDWSNADMIRRACPACRFDGPYQPFVCRPDNLIVVQCPACALYFVSDCPSRTSLMRFYSHYGSTHRALTYGQQIARRMLARYQPRARSRLLRDPRIAGLMKTGGLAGKRVLDVGCSRGEFLLAAQCLGARPMGLDADDEALEFVREQLRLPVIKGDVEQVELPHGAFDVITCWDLVEHLIEPKGTVLKLFNALAPGGRIAFSTPNGGLIDELSDRWVGFRVDLEHLQYLSARTLGLLFDGQHAKFVHIRTFGFPSLISLAKPLPRDRTTKQTVRDHLRQYQVLVATAQKIRSVGRSLGLSPVWRLERMHQGFYLLLIAARL